MSVDSLGCLPGAECALQPSALLNLPAFAALLDEAVPAYEAFWALSGHLSRSWYPAEGVLEERTLLQTPIQRYGAQGIMASSLTFKQNALEN